MEKHPDSTLGPTTRPEDDSDQMRAWAALRLVDDPEVDMNIVELGLVYGVRFDRDRIMVRMTMTSAA